MNHLPQNPADWGRFAVIALGVFFLGWLVIDMVLWAIDMVLWALADGMAAGEPIAPVVHDAACPDWWIEEGWTIDARPEAPEMAVYDDD